MALDLKVKVVSVVRLVGKVGVGVSIVGLVEFVL